MATAFRPDERRDAAAAEIAAGAAGWLQIRLRRPHGTFPAGSKFYGVPSSKADGSFYYTNLKACSCADYAKRGAGNLTVPARYGRHGRRLHFLL